MFCEYSDIFGKPGEGAHAYRLGGVAIVDVIFTLLAAVIISMLSGVSMAKVTVLLFLISIIAHRAFCVRTTVDKLLFPN